LFFNCCLSWWSGHLVLIQGWCNFYSSIKRGTGLYITISNYFLIVALVGGMDIWSSIYKKWHNPTWLQLLAMWHQVIKNQWRLANAKKIANKKKIHIQTSIGKIESAPCVFKSIFPKNWLFNDNSQCKF
jgi:hypothetical protein